jgi:quinoprotein glucose dehydrogenase
VFYDNEATRCTRCHTLQDQGGNAGPNLDRIGSQRSRDHLIESLVLPSQQIADGFATTVVDLHNGEVVAGVATKDQDGVLEIVDVTGQLNQIPWDRIKARKTSTESAMPAMGGTLTLRQLRDVVAFLAAQQKR